MLINSIKMIEKLKRLKIVVYFLKLLNPSYGQCANCGLPWIYCKEKAVSIDNNSGTFATCEYCWKRLSLDELKYHYKSKYIDHKRESIKWGYPMNYTLDHLIDCVEKEYKEDKMLTRYKKIKLIKSKIKKNEKL